MLPVEVDEEKEREIVRQALKRPIELIVGFRQLEVALGIRNPPRDYSIEGFAELPVREATMALAGLRTGDLTRRARERKRGGVSRQDWSKSDRQRLESGELPRGRPLHLDI